MKTGHVTRMPEEGFFFFFFFFFLFFFFLYGELQVGKRSHAGQEKRYKDTSKPPLRTSTYQQGRGNKLHDRTKWRGLIRKGAGEYEAKWISEAKQKLKLRHHQQSFLPQISQVLSATGSLELSLVSSAILGHTNSSTSRIWLRLAIVSYDRRSITVCIIWCRHSLSFSKFYSMQFCNN